MYPLTRTQILVRLSELLGFLSEPRKARALLRALVARMEWDEARADGDMDWAQEAFQSMVKAIGELVSPLTLWVSPNPTPEDPEAREEVLDPTPIKEALEWVGLRADWMYDEAFDGDGVLTISVMVDMTDYVRTTLVPYQEKEV